MKQDQQQYDIEKVQTQLEEFFNSDVFTKSKDGFKLLDQDIKTVRQELQPQIDDIRRHSEDWALSCDLTALQELVRALQESEEHQEGKFVAQEESIQYLQQKVTDLEAKLPSNRMKSKQTKPGDKPVLAPALRHQGSTISSPYLGVSPLNRRAAPSKIPEQASPESATSSIKLNFAAEKRDSQSLSTVKSPRAQAKEQTGFALKVQNTLLSESTGGDLQDPPVPTRKRSSAAESSNRIKKMDEASAR